MWTVLYNNTSYDDVIQYGIKTIGLNLSIIYLMLLCMLITESNYEYE